MARPTYDYVRAGDVLRIDLPWKSARDETWKLYPILRNELAKIFDVLNLDSSRVNYFFGGGNIIIDLRPRTDYSRLSDVVNTVLGTAYNKGGFSVDWAGARGEFVSRVEDTAGSLPVTIPAPAITPQPSANNSGSNPLGNFFGNLSESPMALGLILAGVVVLVIAAKK